MADPEFHDVSPERTKTYECYHRYFTIPRELTMPLDPRQTLSLVDSDGRCLGEVSIERIEGNRIFGRFSRGHNFAAVETLFCQWEEAVNDQMFSLVDQLTREIDRLGLRLASPDGSEQLKLCDVQISNAGDLCCRIPNLGLIQTSETVAQAG